MEIIETGRTAVPATQPVLFPQKSSGSFIEANTKEIDMRELRHDCIIPVFAKDNESTISHNQFIEIVHNTASQFYEGETLLQPAIRVSHPIKGRIPEAMGKPANLLEDEEKTTYYERMAFLIEIPGIYDTVANNHVTLCIGGVRAYNHENLYGKKTAERFKVFIGFQVQVCCNLCISTDGFKAEIKARTFHELSHEVFNMLSEYDLTRPLNELKQLPNYQLSESQFAQLIGRLRMYPHLPDEKQKSIPSIDLGESQINAVVKGYFHDSSFRRNQSGEVSLWQLYNLFTGASQSSYIDRFLARNVSALAFTKGLKTALKEGSRSWYLT